MASAGSDSSNSAPRATLKVGQRAVVEIEKVAHGGHFIARLDGAVIFIRHGIPGERVEIELVSVGKSFSRADVINVIKPSPDRVTPPCSFSGTGQCGGCDFQHIAAERQRDLKADVIEEQFARIAKRELRVVVEEVSGPLHWRTRCGVNIDGQGRSGFYKSRSHDVLPISNCAVLVPELKYSEFAARKHEPNSRVDLSASNFTVGSHTFKVSPQSFWQSHKDAPRVLTEAMLKYADLREGDYVLDLYGGVGLFSAAIADHIGATGHIELVEGSKFATADAKVNFAEDARIEIRTGDVAKILPRISRADVVVLDPPREGAGADVAVEIGRLRPRRVVYIACDPAALARDVTYLEAQGFSLTQLRAFDLFPMTHHIECIALFEAREVS